MPLFLRANHATVDNVTVTLFLVARCLGLPAKKLQLLHCVFRAGFPPPPPLPSVAACARIMEKQFSRRRNDRDRRSRFRAFNVNVFSDCFIIAARVKYDNAAQFRSFPTDNVEFNKSEWGFARSNRSEGILSMIIARRWRCDRERLPLVLSAS